MTTLQLLPLLSSSYTADRDEVVENDIGDTSGLTTKQTNLSIRTTALDEPKLADLPVTMPT